MNSNTFPKTQWENYVINLHLLDHLVGNYEQTSFLERVPSTKSILEI